MAISINSIGILQEYLQGVLDRAGHHANEVEGVALALMGAVIWKSDGLIEVRGYAGTPANMIWFWVNGNRYTLMYNHSTGQIDLKERSNKGVVLHSYESCTTYQQIINDFKNL